MKVLGSSPRDYFWVKNKNVKMTAEVFVENNVEIAHLVVRSNHQDRPDGHGGFYLYANMKDQKLYFKCEETHEKGYSPRLVEEAIKFTPNEWHKLMMVATNEGNNVYLDGMFDDVEIEKVITEKRFAYQGEGKCCFIRTNKPDGVKYRNITIEEI